MFGLRKRTWIIGGVVAALIGTGALASRYYNPSMEDHVYFATYMITKKLELSDAQEASLDKLAKSWIGSAGTMKSFRKAMLDEVKTLATGENLSVEQVNALRDKVKAEIDRRSDELIPEFIAFYNGLDGDQKAKILTRLNNVSKRMEKGDFRHHRGWGGHGPRHWQGSE